MKMSNLELYDGCMDPEDHLAVYKAQMYVQDVVVAAYCRYFPTKRGRRRLGSTALPLEVSLLLGFDESLRQAIHYQSQRKADQHPFV